MSTRYTTLNAVNEMLESIGEPPASALDTGGTSIVAQAESILDREAHQILERGWWANTDPEVKYEPPDRSIAASGGSGSFTFGETITGGTSGAIGTFQYEDGGEVFYFAESGDLQSGETITGSDSGATRNTTAGPSTITEAKVPFGPDVIDAEPTKRSLREKIAMRGDFFYKRDDATFTFDSSFVMAVTYLIDFADLPRYLQRLIVRKAALAFSRAVKGSVQEDAIARQELDRAWAIALQQNDDKEMPNALRDTHGRETRGRRLGRYWLGRWSGVTDEGGVDHA